MLYSSENIIPVETYFQINYHRIRILGFILVGFFAYYNVCALLKRDKHYLAVIRHLCAVPNGAFGRYSLTSLKHKYRYY